MRRSRRGYILIQALVAVAGLLALMAILVADDKASLDNVQSSLRQARAQTAADGAVQQALAVLSTGNEYLVTNNDTWAQLGSTGTEEFDFPDNSSFRMQVVDAGSLINLNSASQQQLQELPLDQDQVDCLLDWIQAGENPRSDGAKDQFYNALPVPYNAKLGPLTTVNELLLVDNWTAQTLYQPPTDSTTLTMPTDENGNILPLASLFTVDSGSPNTSTTGATLVNLDTRTVSTAALRRIGINPQMSAEILSRVPIANFKALFQLPGMNLSTMSLLANAVTFTTATRTTGKIDLNTASQTVLQSLPFMNSATAATVVSQQSTGYTSLGAFVAGAGLPAATIAQIADDFTVGSDTWIVRAYGQCGGVGIAEEAVVGLRGTTAQIEVISVNRLHTAGIPSWWGWDQASTSTQQAGVTQ
jgi:type II secretory pathway component PulK